MIVIGYEREDGEYDYIWWDAVISRSHRMSNVVTQFPVEGGGKISDHIACEPISLSLEGFITDSPTEKTGMYPVSGGLTRSQQAFAKLKELWERRCLIDIFTPFEFYEGFALVSIDVPEDRSHSGGMWVTVQCQEVTLVESQAVRIAPKPKKRPGWKEIDEKLALLEKNLERISGELREYAKRELKKLDRKEELKERMKKIENAKDIEEINDLKKRWALEDMLEELGGR